MSEAFLGQGKAGLALPPPPIDRPARCSDAWSTPVDHPTYGPIATLDDLPTAGPVFRSRSGLVRWRADGSPDLRPAIGPSFTLGYRNLP